MDMRKLVGRNVRRIRLEKSLTQEQFADRSGFAQQYLSDLERGRRNPTVVTLFELSQALGVTPIELITPDAEALIPEARCDQERAFDVKAETLNMAKRKPRPADRAGLRGRLAQSPLALRLRDQMRVKASLSSSSKRLA